MLFRNPSHRSFLGRDPRINGTRRGRLARQGDSAPQRYAFATDGKAENVDCDADRLALSRPPGRDERALRGSGLAGMKHIDNLFVNSEV